MENPLSLEGKHHLLRRLQLWGKNAAYEDNITAKKLTNRSYTIVERACAKGWSKIR